MPKLQQQIKKIYNANSHYGNRGYAINSAKGGLGGYGFIDRHHSHKTYGNYTTDDSISTGTTHTSYRERFGRAAIKEDDDSEETNYTTNIRDNEDENGDDEDEYEDNDDNDGYGEDNDSNEDIYEDNDGNEGDYDSNDDAQTCQVCYNQLDDSERMFKPCRCGFKICTFCLNDTKICPGCKTPYSPSVFEQHQLLLESTFLKKKKEQRKKGGRKEGTIQTLTTSFSGYYSPTQPQHYTPTQTFQNASFSLTSPPMMHPKSQMHQQYGNNTGNGNSTHYNSFDKRKLENVRVVQRNLVYVTNIPLNFISRGGETNYSINGQSPNVTNTNASETNILSQNEYFGQYGRIIKLVVNYNVAYNSSTSHGQTVSCYVTYHRNEDALTCINAVNGAWLAGKLLRASFGTTKYCTYFLKGVSCANPDCLYLHKLGSEKDSFTKESMAAGKNLFSDCVHPKISYDDKGNNIFSPPSLAQAFSSNATIAYEQAAQIMPPKYGDVIGSVRTWKSFTVVTSTTPLSKKVYTAFVPADSANVGSSDLKQQQQQQQQRLGGYFSLESGLEKGALLSQTATSMENKQLIKRGSVKHSSSQEDDGDNDDSNNDTNEGTNGDNSNYDGTPRSLDGLPYLNSSFITNDGNRLKSVNTSKERGEPGISDLISFEALMSSDNSRADNLGRNIDDNIEFCNGFLSLNCDCNTLFSVIQKQSDENEKSLYSSDFYQKMFSPKSFPQIYPHSFQPFQQKQQSILERRPSLPSLSPSPSSSISRQYQINRFRGENVNSTSIQDHDFLLVTAAFSSGIDFYSNNNLGESSHSFGLNDGTKKQIGQNDVASQLLFGCDFRVSSLCERTFGSK